MATKISIDQIAVPADIKLVNRQKILETFLDGRRQTIAAIHAATGISKPTTMRALQYFCQRGLLRSAGHADSNVNGGRKSELFEFADSRKILTIGLWPDAITLALADLVGSEVYGVSRFEHSLEGDLDEEFRYLARRLKEYFRDQGIGEKDLYGVALSVSGLVDDGKGVLRYDSQTPAWGKNVPLGERLEKLFSVPLVFQVDNGGKACGRAILLDYPELAQRRALSIFSTWGLSACLIERGHILNGRDALIGEIGHMQIADCEEALCGCGKRRCLEGAVSRERVRGMLERDGAQWLQEEPFSFQRLFRYSRQGDEAARKAVRYLAHCMASALHNLSLCYNQEVVVFQGDLAWADAFFDRCLKEELSEFRYYPEEQGFAVVYDKHELSTLAARGDAALLRKRYFSAMEYE